MSISVTSDRKRLVEKLRGQSCQYCEDGTLQTEQYKGNDAVVCAECETPALQLW